MPRRSGTLHLHPGAAGEEYNTNLASTNDRITYRYHLVAAEKAEDEEEYSEEALADAKAKAETIAEAAGEAEDLTELTVDGEEIIFTETTAFASSLDSSYSEWLLGSGRKAGDITTAETSSGCYVVVFDSRDDNSGDTVNVRHILIEAEPTRKATTPTRPRPPPRRGQRRSSRSGKTGTPPRRALPPWRRSTPRTPAQHQRRAL